MYSDLKNKYSRISKHVDFKALFNTRLIIIGTGASSHLIEWFCRMGIKKFTLCDIDTVEQKNLAVQSFDHDDIGKAKVDAIEGRLQKIQFEQNNADVPKLDIIKYHQDFLTLSDEEVMRGEGNKILIMSSDYHPVQARGSRLAIKYKVPTFWVGIYREAMAGEIIFYDKKNMTAKAPLPCYRCITESRYTFFNNKHMQKHLDGNFEGSGKSSGLPMVATMLDSLLAHLVIGAIHIDDQNNQHARFYKKILKENRNLIQMQFSPEYKLGSEDLFSQIKGNDVISFNTLFQKEDTVNNCSDCIEFKNNIDSKPTDYTQDFFVK